MGTDIHMAVEVRRDGRWQAVKWPNKWYKSGMGLSTEEQPETYRAYSDRNYDVFAILANVRNGSGFAGCDTGDGFSVIAEPRGVPEDISREAKAELSNEHTPSWVTLAELLAFDWTQVATQRGWVNGPQFEKWDRMKPWNPVPDEYYGGISGRDIEHITAKEMRSRVKQSVKDGPEYHDSLQRFTEQNKNAYCLVEWQIQYSAAAGSFWEIWVPRLLKLLNDTKGPTPTYDGPLEASLQNIRLVFDFDS